MASNAQGEGGSGNSSSKRVRKNARKNKAPRVRQRGMGVAQLERLRIQEQIAAAAAASAANAATGSAVPNSLHNVPVFQLHEGMMVQNPYYLSSLLTSVPPSFSPAPVKASLLVGPQGVKEDLSLQMPPYDFWQTSDPAPSSTPSGSHCPQGEKVSMGSEGSDIQLGLGTSRPVEEEADDDLEFRQPNYFTNLLLAEDYEDKETGQKNKKARTDSSGQGGAAAGTSSSQEPDLELRLFF